MARDNDGPLTRFRFGNDDDDDETNGGSSCQPGRDMMKLIMNSRERRGGGNNNNDKIKANPAAPAANFNRLGQMEQQNG
ncbi:hypothetical protein ACLKA6_018750 [Drosophila palustris]